MSIDSIAMYLPGDPTVLHLQVHRFIKLVASSQIRYLLCSQNTYSILTSPWPWVLTKVFNKLLYVMRLDFLDI